MLPDELLDGFDEVPRHRLHGVGGGHLGFSLLPDESQCTLNDLQPWDDGIQIHPVDAFNLQNHMLVQHVGNGLW
jgi:hypothetical protein